MRVLVVIGCYPPDHGGAGLRIANTYDVMSVKNDLQWRVVTQSREKSREDTDRVRYVEIEKISGKFSLIKEIAFGGYDIVHCIGENPLTYFAAFCSFLCGRKYIAELSVDPDTRTPSFLYALRMAAFYKANGFIALTPRLAEIFRRKSPRTKVFLRPNPVTFGQRKMDGVSAILPEKQYAHRHLLLGRFLPRKGHLQALHVLQYLPDHELVLAGPVTDKKDGAYLQELQDFVAANDLGQRVVFRPEFIKDVASLVAQADSIWCLSEREGLPNIVLESLSLGRPVFVNAGLGLEHIVTDGVNGYNLHGTAENQAARVAQSMQTGFDSEKIAAQAKDAFSLEKHAEKTWEFLNETRNG